MCLRKKEESISYGRTPLEHRCHMAFANKQNPTYAWTGERRDSECCTNRLQLDDNMMMVRIQGLKVKTVNDGKDDDTPSRNECTMRVGLKAIYNRLSQKSADE
jgi:hypothetical protein